MKTIISWSLTNSKVQGKKLSLISPPHNLPLSLRKELRCFLWRTKFFEQALKTPGPVAGALGSHQVGKSSALLISHTLNAHKWPGHRSRSHFFWSVIFWENNSNFYEVITSMVYDAPVTSVFPSLIHTRELQPQWDYLSTLFIWWWSWLEIRNFISWERPLWGLPTIKTGYGINLHFDKIN